MKRKIDLGAVIVLMLLVATVTWLVALWQTTEAYNSQIEKILRVAEEFKKIEQIKEYIETAYVGSWDEEKLLDGAAGGMMDSLGDKWSGYLNYEDYQSYKDSRENRVVGIGVSATRDDETGGILITEVYGDSPAFDANLLPLDIIITVDGESLRNMAYEQAVERIRGDAGTVVNLEIYRPSTDETFKRDITRREVQIESVRSRILEGGIGYIRIRNFDKGTDAKFVEAVTNLMMADVRGFIFDVRNNPGGAKEVMLPMLDMLLPEGVLFQYRDKGGEMIKDMSDANSVDLPMIVIINENSYSAAEFFAAALKEYDYAELVGRPTTGKGFGQSPIELSDGSGIILSTIEYFTPNGVSLADVGIKPDYSVVLTDDEAARFHVMEPSEDRQIVKAYDVLNVKIEKLEEQARQLAELEAALLGGEEDGDAGDP